MNLEAWVRECWDRLYPAADWSGAKSAVSVMEQEIQRRRATEKGESMKDPIPDQLTAGPSIDDIVGAVRVIRAHLAKLIARKEALIAERNRLDAEIDTLETLYAELRYQLEHAEEANPCR